jgi:GDP-L-fucose synthase
MLNEEVKNYFATKYCLVTGGTGLIGRQVVDLLLDCDANVISVSLDDLELNPRASYEKADLSDYSVCLGLTKSIECVFHVAGIKGSIKVTKEKPASFFVPLLMMNTNILEACRINKVEKVVYTSSVGAYPSAEVFREENNDFSAPPMDEYPGWAKRMAELQIQAYKVQYGLTNFAVVRPANIYGPGDNFDPENAMVIPSLIHRLFNGEDPLTVWGHGRAIRDFAYSKDVAEGILQACYYGTNGFVNLGSGQETSIQNLVHTLQEVYFFLTGKRTSAFFDETKPSGYPRRVMNISKAMNLIGYNPSTSLKDGLIRTMKWYQYHQNEYSKRKNYFNE